MRDPGSEAAWREFEGSYAELMRRYCRRRGLKTADIDDVGQMVWSKLAKGLREFNYDPSKEKFRGDLFRVVRNAITRQFAHQLDNVEWASHHEDPASLIRDSQSRDDEWEQEQVVHHFRLAMTTVEQTFDAKSIAIFGRFIAGDMAAEIASDFDITVAVVNQAKHRIRMK